jgi:hypothetical protein
VYDGLSEIILSVSLSAPKPGIFLDSIKYVIAIGEVNVQFSSQIFLLCIQRLLINVYSTRLKCKL